ncbi:HYR domain-containing protein [Halobacillus litoralis]|uniref:HYR domain-containing protein n=1 Tax=Halobacillus litoralis TaxID=45668 RepID=UPI0021F57EF5|nr:HYR domain-containing protein [Halobacillus litoralis]WLR46547.1 HYR domain-containing protein [Halobacillus litoralis]
MVNINFNFVGPQLQIFEVPDNVCRVTIQAIGARGGNTGPNEGGAGASLKGDFTVTPGEILSVLVGEAGMDTNASGAGGGGGSFVWRGSGYGALNNSSLLLAAGGGGGAGVRTPGKSGSIIADGLPGFNGGDDDGGEAGEGGTSLNGGPGGAGGGIGSGDGMMGGPGFGGGGGGAGGSNVDGGGGGGAGVSGFGGEGGDGGFFAFGRGGEGGQSIVNGGAGGPGGSGDDGAGGNGGFGGGAGGGGDGNSLDDGGGGGAGGFAGGGGGGGNGGGGGGAGSYNAGDNPENVIGVGTGNGLVVITFSAEPPTIQCPDNITVEKDSGECGAFVFYPDPIVQDDCPATFSCDPPSGSFFPIGTSVVECIAIDVFGNTSEPCTFEITVTDTEPPMITCPNDITDAVYEGAGGKVVFYPDPDVSDNCSTVTSVCTPASGSFFPVGTTVVTCTATDASGNTSTCTFTITVVELPVACIRTIKVYDWLVDFVSRDDRVEVPSDCQEVIDALPEASFPLAVTCTPPEVPGAFPLISNSESEEDAFCIISSNIERRTFNVGGTDVELAIIKAVFRVSSTVSITDANGNNVCTFTPTITLSKKLAVCLPEPLTRDNILCRITQVTCDENFLEDPPGGDLDLQLDITVCFEIQVEAEVKLGILEKLCQPRPNDIDISLNTVCPTFEFPRQCETVFPRPHVSPQRVQPSEMPPWQPLKEDPDGSSDGR